MAQLPVPALAPGCQSSWPQHWEQPWSWHGGLEGLQSPGESREPAELRILHLHHNGRILPRELCAGSQGARPSLSTFPSPSSSGSSQFPQQHRNQTPNSAAAASPCWSTAFQKHHKTRNGLGKEAENSLKGDKFCGISGLTSAGRCLS